MDATDSTVMDDGLSIDEGSRTIVSVPTRHGAPSTPGRERSSDDALVTLVDDGVTENSSFEEIQAAKKRLYEQHGNDSAVLEEVEIAYDSIIMDRLRLRQEGKIKVPDRIRFAEETPEVNANQIQQVILNLIINDTI